MQRIANKQSNRKSLVIVYRKNRLLGRTQERIKGTEKVSPIHTLFRR